MDGVAASVCIIGWYINSFPLDNMATISQTTFSNAFSRMKSFVFCFEFHLVLFLRVQLTINQHWFMEWLGSHYLNQCWTSPLTIILREDEPRRQRQQHWIFSSKPITGRHYFGFPMDWHKQTSAKISSSWNCAHVMRSVSLSSMTVWWTPVWFKDCPVKITSAVIPNIVQVTLIFDPIPVYRGIN